MGPSSMLNFKGEHGLSKEDKKDGAHADPSVAQLRGHKIVRTSKRHRDGIGMS